MRGKNINFDDKKIKRSSFYKNKKINNIEDIDVNNILVSKKEPYGTKNSHKYFIGFNDNDNQISSYTLFNKHNLNLYANDEMGYIGMRREIKSEVLYCVKQKIRNPKAQVR